MQNTPRNPPPPRVRELVFILQLQSNTDSLGDINCPAFLGCLMGSKAGPRGKRRPQAKRSVVGSLAKSTDLIKVRDMDWGQQRLPETKVRLKDNKKGNSFPILYVKGTYAGPIIHSESSLIPPG